jgi:prophage regulatory protein
MHGRNSVTFQIPPIRKKTVAKRLLRRPDVKSRVGLETSQIYHLISEGKFPAPVPIGARAVAWVEEEIDSWIDERISEREHRATSHLKKQAFVLV